MSMGGTRLAVPSVRHLEPAKDCAKGHFPFVAVDGAGVDSATRAPACAAGAIAVIEIPAAGCSTWNFQATRTSSEDK